MAQGWLRGDTRHPRAGVVAMLCWSSHEELLHVQDNHDGVITHLEPDILECEVKWALGSITTKKASEGDGIPVEPFQILKDDAVKVLQLSMPANLENSADT